MIKISRTPLFWVALSSLCLVSSIFAYEFYPKAFPVVPLDIRMNRTAALDSAKALAVRHSWQPTEPRQAVDFESDDQVQTFVELGKGGSDAFLKLLSQNVYSPYTWKVRQFKEGDLHESLLWFTPQGRPYGFKQVLPETEPGAALTSAQARSIAEHAAIKDWDIHFENYVLAETSQQTRPGKRIDHTFVYERPDSNIGEGGEGRFRMRLIVSGDQLTELRQYIKIPEAFSRHYSEMRSANETIAGLSSVAMILLYFLGGCGLGLFFLARSHWVIWKTPVLVGGAVAALMALENLNHLPLVWMGYDTALSARAFLAHQLLSTGMMFLGEFFLLSISFMAAESLTRRAFPHHPQLWKSTSLEAMSSIPIIGRVFGGYLTVGFFHAFVVSIYFLAKKYLGWWNPSETLFHPDVLATYAPWLTSIANSAHAGLWEECLFRAVPLAGAALIGQKFGHRRMWITAGFLVQILIFASAHANYMAQPPYARVVELILPSTLFGALYLIYGLIPGIILHFTFDAVSFALPLFAANSGGIWFERLAVMGVGLLPVWLILYARARTGNFHDLKKEYFNSAWSPLHPDQAEKKPGSAAPLKSKSTLKLTPRTSILLFLAALAAVSVWASIARFKSDTPKLWLTRDQATQAARTALTTLGTPLSAEWKALSVVQVDPGSEHRFTWEKSGSDIYRSLLGTYLEPPCWLVRFVRFNADVAERAEEYQVYLMKSGDIYRIRHELPEARPGANLKEAQARAIALGVLRNSFHLAVGQYREVSSDATRQPHRTDWVFVFSDLTKKLEDGEARLAVRIAGEEVASYRRFIFVPEAWTRNERNRQSVTGMISQVVSLAISLIFAGGILFAIVSWIRKRFSTRVFAISLGTLIVLGIIDLLNDLPRSLAYFSTAQPFSNQLVSLLTSGAVATLFFNACISLLLGSTHHSIFSSQGKTKSESLLKWPAVLSAYSVGFLIAASTHLVGSHWAKLHAIWPSFAGLDSYWPAAQFLQGVPALIMRTAILLWLFQLAEWIVMNWKFKRGAGAVVLILFLIPGAVVASSALSESFAFWSAKSLFLGISLYAAYRFIFRSRLGLLPLAVAGFSTLTELQQIAMGAFPGARWIGAASVAVMLGLSYFWTRATASSAE